MTPARRALLCRRALLLVFTFALFLAIGVRTAPVAEAVLAGTKSCVGPSGATTASVGDTVTCTLTLTGTPTDIPAGALINILSEGGNYTFAGAASCVTAPGTCAILTSASVITLQCSPPADPQLPCTQVTLTEALTITATAPGSITQRITVNSGVALIITIPFFVPGNAFFVAPPPLGDDDNNCQTRDEACETLNRALEVARDEDTIFMLRGEYRFVETVVVTKLVTILPDAAEKVVIRLSPGITGFDVRAQGYPGLHVTISNLTIGGNYRAGSTEPVFRLVDDNYTEISANIIGAEDLPINNGIVLVNSDHTDIDGNVFQGNTRFVFPSIFEVGRTVTGFGVVTIECLGQVLPGVSDGVTIENNLFTNLWVAGVWMCSDGAGNHVIGNNVFRNNWRGIALKDVTNSLINANTLIDNRSDGIIVYGTSLRNLVDENRVESHVGPDAAGIRIGWLADPNWPLDNRLERNRIVRATLGVHVFGAHTTQLRSNEVKVSGGRTAVLISTSDLRGGPETQPLDTEITDNVLVYEGPCTATQGCAIRLLNVTVPVLATNNDWGLRRESQVQSVLWDRFDDPRLGPVIFLPFKNQVAEAFPTTGATAAPAPAASSTPNGTATATTTATAVPSVAVAPLPTATPLARATPPAVEATLATSGPSLRFSATALALAGTGQSNVVTITADGLGAAVDGIQVNIQYDPALLSLTEPECRGIFGGGIAALPLPVDGGTLLTCFLERGVGASGTGEVLRFRVTRVAAGDAVLRFGLAGGVATRASQSGAPLAIATSGELLMSGGGDGGAVIANRTQSYSRSVLTLNQECVPPAGERVCDEARTRLWYGDAAAWEARRRAEGQAELRAGELANALLEFRLKAGSPLAIVAVAAREGWAHVRPTAVQYRGEEWVELRNLGGKAQDLQGWSLRVEHTEGRWTFGGSMTLRPGEACRLYTATPGPLACRGVLALPGSGALPDSEATLSLWVDALDLLALRAVYSANVDRQPPLPHLQGTP